MIARLVIWLLLVALVRSPCLIHAAEQIQVTPTAGALEELKLLKEEMVVTAARHEQPISESPSNIYVITDEDIRHSGAIDIPTVLRQVPGIEVMQMSGAEFNVSARGDNQLLANKFLVLVDGRSIYVDAQGFVFWKALPVTLPEIKRIEVLKGPASALYGFNAFDGVVNIITKSPEEMKGTTLQFGGGEFGTITASAVEAGVHGRFGYRLSAGRDQTNHWSNRDALAFRDHKFNVQTEYALTPSSQLRVSGGLTDANKFDGPIFRGATILDSTFALPYAAVSYERPNFFLRTFWNRFDASSRVSIDPRLAGLILATDPQGRTVLSFLGDTYDVEAQHAVELGTVNRLSYGINYRYNTFTSNSADGFNHENRLGFYVQDEWSVSGTFRIVAGLRYDLHTEIPGTFSPRLALLYTPVRDQTLRASIAVAYRPPTLFETHERLIGTTFPGTPFAIITPINGSANLAPEQMISYELGYQGWFLKHRLRVRADAFYNHISDLIETVGTPTVFTNVNTQEADIYGGEAGIEFLATTWLTGFINYSQQEIRQKFDAGRGGPRLKASAGVRGEWENGWSAQAALYHVGAAVYPISDFFTNFSSFGVVAPDTRVGSYNLLNLRGAYRFWHDTAEVAVSAFNALNDRHKEHPLGEVIGSRVMGWLAIRF